MTVVLLAAWLSCSIATARRRLKAWSTYTSYNHNGRYYTLPEIAEFDDNGLWHHQGVFFSKHGNLKQTLVHLVSHSVQGLSGAELGKLLGLQPRSFLSHFRDHPALKSRINTISTKSLRFVVMIYGASSFLLSYSPIYSRLNMKII